MSFLGLFLIYGLYPLGLYGFLRGRNYHARDCLLIPFCLGLGPLLASWIAEIFLWASIHPKALTFVATMWALPVLSIFAHKAAVQDLLRKGAENAFSVIACLVLLMGIWFICGDQIIISWDPACFRLVADRIANEGVISPGALTLEPTINELLMVHAFHGPRYPLILALNRIIADTNLAAIDVFPAVWFHWSSLLLIGGAAASSRGWHGFTPWLGILLGAASYQALLWTMVGQSASASAFGFLAAGVAYWRAAASFRDQHQSILLTWMLAGLVLGLAVGIHRTSLTLGIFPLVFLWAIKPFEEDNRKAKKFIAIILSALTTVAVIGLWEWHMWLDLGGLGLDIANPVSGSLVEFRASWRAAFEAQPLALAWQQFWDIKIDALLWWFTALTGVFAFYKYLVSHKHQTDDRRIVIAFALSTAILLLILSDLTLLLYSVQQELMVRSMRYRSHLLPLLLFMSLLVLTRTQFAASLAAITRRVPRSAIALSVISIALLLQLGLLHIHWPSKLPSGTDGIKRRFVELSRTDEWSRIRQISPDTEAVVKHLNAIERSSERLLLDFPALFGQIDQPMRNAWLNPGVFPILAAADPRQAADAAIKEQGIRWHLFRIAHSGTVLFSSTGLRHLHGIDHTRLLVDTKTLQLFELSDEADKNTLANRMPIPSSESGSRFTPLLASNLVNPGEYELIMDFESPAPLSVYQLINNKTWRRFVFRAFKPHIPGPQRIRFRLAPGQSTNFRLLSNELAAANFEKIEVLHRPSP